MTGQDEDGAVLWDRAFDCALAALQKPQTEMVAVAVEDYINSLRSLTPKEKSELGIPTGDWTEDFLEKAKAAVGERLATASRNAETPLEPLYQPRPPTTKKKSRGKVTTSSASPSSDGARETDENGASSSLNEKEKENPTPQSTSIAVRNTDGKANLQVQDTEDSRPETKDNGNKVGADATGHPAVTPLQTAAEKPGKGGKKTGAKSKVKKQKMNDPGEGKVAKGSSDTNQKKKKSRDGTKKSNTKEAATEIANSSLNEVGKKIETPTQPASATDDTRDTVKVPEGSAGMEGESTRTREVTSEKVKLLSEKKASRKEAKKSRKETSGDLGKQKANGAKTTKHQKERKRKASESENKKGSIAGKRQRVKPKGKSYEEDKEDEDSPDDFGEDNDEDDGLNDGGEHRLEREEHTEIVEMSNASHSADGGMEGDKAKDKALPTGFVPGMETKEWREIYKRIIPRELREKPWGPVRLSTGDKAKLLTVSDDGLSVVGNRGYRTVRGIYGVWEGDWYFEVLIHEPQGGIGNVRIGWSTRRGILEGPTGTDKHGWSVRDLTGELFHEAKGSPYGSSYGPGDVIGCRISVPMISEELKEKIAAQELAHIEYVLIDKEQAKLPPEPETFWEDGYVEFFKDGVSFGTAQKGIRANRYYPSISLYKGGSVSLNFGPTLKFTPPPGSRPMCDMACEKPPTPPPTPETQAPVEEPNGAGKLETETKPAAGRKEPLAVKCETGAAEGNSSQTEQQATQGKDAAISNLNNDTRTERAIARKAAKDLVIEGTLHQAPAQAIASETQTKEESRIEPMQGPASSIVAPDEPSKTGGPQATAQMVGKTGEPGLTVDQLSGHEEVPPDASIATSNTGREGEMNEEQQKQSVTSASDESTVQAEGTMKEMDVETPGSEMIPNPQNQKSNLEISQALQQKVQASALDGTRERTEEEGKNERSGGGERERTEEADQPVISDANPVPMAVDKDGSEVAQETVTGERLQNDAS